MDGLKQTEDEFAAQIHREYAPSAGAQALAKMATHEAICVLRYEHILARISRLEAVIITAAGALIVGLGGLTFTLIHAPR